MQDISRRAATLSREPFTRRLVLPMAGIVILAMVIVLGFVVVSADSQNRLEVQSSTALAETALAVKKREIARNLQDYAVWEDAYKNLHEQMNFEWASTDGNVGANIYQGLGYDMAFVVKPGRKTTYSVLKGVPQNSDAFAVVPFGLEKLIATGVSDAKPAVGLLAIQVRHSAGGGDRDPPTIGRSLDHPCGGAHGAGLWKSS